MKIGKNYIISQSELDAKIEAARKKGVKAGEEKSKTRVESLETALERKTKAHAKLEKTNEDLEAEIAVYQKERDNVKEVIKQRLENDDIKAGLEARKEALDRKEARLKDVEFKLESEENRQYKSGYADGAADATRKINEITQADRDNMAKVAMVSAASHTSPQIVREVMNGANQLTAGTTDQEG